MAIKHLHSTRFLPINLGILLVLALSGCAGTPEEPEVEAVLLPPAEPVRREVVLKPDYPEKYVVVKGDTLWDISGRFLKDPWMWPRLWHFNQQIDNPHLIYPGDILTIVFINGKPVMQVTRGGRVLGPRAEGALPYPTVKLSPRIREEGLEQAIPTISIDAIGPFLNRPRVLTQNELEQAPYVVANTDDRMMAGQGYKIYTRGLQEENLQGDYILVRAGATYINPENENDVLGYEAIYLGEARLTHFGDPSTMKVTASQREILRGDRLLPKGDEIVQHSYSPRSPEQPVKGQIIAVVDGVGMIGQGHIVVLNLGRQEDVEPGHVLAVKQRGQQIRDIVSGDDEVALPTEKAGTIMIFRVFDRVSYALVMDATRTIRVNDLVTNH